MGRSWRRAGVEVPRWQRPRVRMASSLNSVTTASIVSFYPRPAFAQQALRSSIRIRPKKTRSVKPSKDAPDDVLLLFSNELLDHPRQGRLSHYGLGWRYGDDSDGIKPGD